MAQGEIPFLSWLAASAEATPDLEVGIGDDGAVWRLPSGERLVVAADVLAEGTHFRTEDEPRRVGNKALAVNLSDLAAMGAVPRFAVATCALPRGFSLELAQELTAGLRETGARFGCPLIGGDTISHDGGVVLSVTVVGTVPNGGAPFLRSGARGQDILFVTGPIGGSLRFGRHLRVSPRLHESQLLRELGPPSAAIDISDGLLLDLWRLADASGVGFVLDAAAIPLHADAEDWSHAVRDGEDFELLFTVAPEHLSRVLSGPWPVTPVAIGHMVADPHRRVIQRGGMEWGAGPEGYSHG